MKKKKIFAVLGLGRFGMTLAKSLSEMNQDVIAIDKDIDLIEKADEFATAYSLDFTDLNALKEVGVGDCDEAIVSCATSLEESILAVLNLKELNVKKVLVKAKDERYGEVLKKIGADEIILPETEMANRLAMKIASQSNVLELYNLGNDCLVFEMKTKDSWVGKSLVELQLRSKYSINIIGIKKGDKLSMILDPNKPFEKDESLVAVSSEEAFKNIDLIK